MASAIVKVFALLALAFVVMETVDAAMQTAPAIAQNGMCYYQKLKAFLPPGDSMPIPGCKQITCLKKGEQYYMRTITCGKVDKQCRIPGDKSLPYPECCARNGCLELE